MKIIVPFVLVLGTLVLLLVLAIILLFRKRRAAHAAHVEEQQSIAQRERRRSRRARRHGLLTRREIETIAVESTHCPNAATVVIHDDSSSEEDEEEGHAAGRGGGGKGGDGGAGGSLGGGCSSVTGSSIDDDRAEVLSGAGEGSSAAPPGGNRRELGGKAAGGGTRDCTDADHAVERDVEADVVSDIEAAKARRAKDPERSRAGDFTPGSTLTCAICLDTVEFGELKRTLPCSHEYHSTCVRAWLKKVARCPQCNNLTLVVRQRLMRRARRDAEAEERVRATVRASGAALAASGVRGADAGGGGTAARPPAPPARRRLGPPTRCST
ncbi:hypothetical protein BU14_0121s0042 [Porphyra umbilicalis]|uniref:RING-type domain-containing protein n=1 Tax=Porphyra umbilicalis TaxID=2786 RepID=A0A1X6PB92_PORUM|nr:hypothetical protein BU14_0121s0042 [Porphyra umbilicalis]|eukprot:OSX78114.1 hypothetical protein BU14_0121s0042 [Porphyra umbilicalis]